MESFYSPQGGIEFEYLTDATYILNECYECGLIYQKEVLNDTFMKKLYEEWIDPDISFTKTIQDHERVLLDSLRYAQEIAILINYFKNTKERLKFFDFGMGWAKWCEMAKVCDCDVYGCELSKARIEYAKSLGIKIINWDEIPNFKFDFINTDAVFEHISNPLETLQHLKKALNKRGIIKIGVPNGKDLKRLLNILDWTALKRSKNSLNLVSPLEHINCFNYNSINKMAEKADLEEVEVPLNINIVANNNYKLLILTFKNILKLLSKIVIRKNKNTILFFRQKN